VGKFIKVAKTSELPAGSGKVVDLEGKEVGLFNCDGTFYAIDNICKHQGGPLGEGYVEGTIVTCPWHGWEYDVSTGACQTNPAAKQATFNVKVEGDDILIEV